MLRLVPIISIGLLILVILGGVLFWWPKLQDFSDKKEELTRKEIEVNQKKEYFVALNSLSDKLKGYSEELARIDSALPTDLSIPALFNFIQVSSSENGLVLENLTLGKTSSQKEMGGAKEISLSVSVSGSYSAFKNFLSALYKNVRMIEVNSIKFSSPAEDDLFEFNLALTTYSYLESKIEEEAGTPEL